MTMDEVNERFPMTKYKNWVAGRASEGLPTTGGVASVPASRAASLRDAEGVIPSSPTGTKMSDDRPMTAKSTSAPEVTVSPATNTLGGVVGSGTRTSTDGGEKKMEANPPMASLTEVDTVATGERKSEEDDDEEDHIHAALPPELVQNPGDTCAICIDNLEPDDDVRGLTCGHAFHAGCLDPWLTGRRACCPLCKADYFVPKPRPEGEVVAEALPRRGTMGRMPAQPRSAFLLGVRGPRGMVLPGRFLAGNTAMEGNNAQRSRRTQHNTLEPQVTGTSGVTGDTATPPSRSFASRIRNPFSDIASVVSRGHRNAAAVPADSVTPAQLESGVVR
jgi:hypothetical protein